MSYVADHLTCVLQLLALKKTFLTRFSNGQSSFVFQNETKLTTPLQGIQV